MFANFNRASRTQLGGGDENVHLANLQVERPQGVVVDVGDDTISACAAERQRTRWRPVNHRLHMLGSPFMPPQFDCICNYRACQERARDFPEGIRIRSRPRRESVTDSYREPAVQWLSDLHQKKATGFELANSLLPHDLEQGAVEASRCHPGV